MMTVIWGTKQGQAGQPAPDVTVPDVSGKTVMDADRTLEHANLNLTASGNMQGHATTQTPTSGSVAKYGDYVSVTFA